MQRTHSKSKNLYLKNKYSKGTFKIGMFKSVKILECFNA